jgi:hypothetical protein
MFNNYPKAPIKSQTHKSNMALDATCKTFHFLQKILPLIVGEITWLHKPTTFAFVFNFNAQGRSVSLSQFDAQC